MRVLIVDDNEMNRTVVRCMLDAAGLEIAEAEGAELGLSMIDHEDYDVVLMDLRMPQVDGVTATERVRARPDAPQVLVLTTFDTDEEILGALRAGACGYLLKDSPPPRIVEAVRRAADGETTLSPGVARRLVEHAVGRADSSADARRRLARLTDREREVVAAVGRGLTNADIAAELYVSVATVKAQVSHILGALDLANRTQVALLAHDAGLV